MEEMTRPIFTSFMGLTRTVYTPYVRKLFCPAGSNTVMLYIHHTCVCMMHVGLCRVGQNRIYTPHMTVYLVIPCQKYRIYTVYINGSGQP